MDLQSILGYSKNSPYINNPYLDIHSPEGLIDMSNTAIDLIGIDNQGNKKKMKAFNKNPYKFNGDVIREIPYQRGGNVYDFLFKDDEEDNDKSLEKDADKPSAPSTAEIPQISNDEYESTLAMAMQSYNDPFLNRRQFQSIPHGLDANISSEDMNIVTQSAQKYNIPPEILAGIYGAETSFGKNIHQSSVGAQGPFQFMPATAKQYNVNPYDLQSSSEGAAHYLSNLYNQFGNWEQAIGAYNAGPGNIRKGRIPQETRKYVPKVLGYAQSLKGK